MGKGRKQPEPEQLEDARRLRKLWENRERDQDGYQISQLEFAHTVLKVNSQGTVHQYLKPIIPLNIDIALKFASGLKCRVADFSPTLSERIRSAAIAEGFLDSALAHRQADKSTRVTARGPSADRAVRPRSKKGDRKA